MPPALQEHNLGSRLTVCEVLAHKQLLREHEVRIADVEKTTITEEDVNELIEKAITEYNK